MTGGVAGDVVPLILALMALARPQYGQLEETVFDQSREVLLALDRYGGLQQQEETGQAFF
jgi:hypothetical protein